MALTDAVEAVIERRPDSKATHTARHRMKPLRQKNIVAEYTVALTNRHKYK